MSRMPAFECDACGSMYGHLNELIPVPVRRETRSFEPPEESNLHVCVDCDADALFMGNPLANIEFFGVTRSEYAVRGIEVNGEFTSRRHIENEEVLALIEFMEEWMLSGSLGSPTGEEVIA